MNYFVLVYCGDIVRVGNVALALQHPPATLAPKPVPLEIALLQSPPSEPETNRRDPIEPAKGSLP